MGSRLLVVGNLLKVWLLLIAVCAVLGGIGWALDGYSLFSIFVFSGLLLGAGMWWYADRAALAGVAKPRLYVMSDGLPRACSAGRGPRSSTIAVSKGLLQALPPAELEGVLAHLGQRHVQHP